MSISKCTWQNLRKALAVGSIMIGSMAASLPDAYSKIGFAIALGLSNAAIWIKAEEAGQNPDIPPVPKSDD